MGGAPVSAERPLDDWDRVDAANRDPVPDTRRAVALGLILAQVERALGSGFVFNPARWRTADGYVPYRVLVAAYRTLPSVAALERLQLIRAIQIAQAGPAGQRALDSDIALASGDR